MIEIVNEFERHLIEDSKRSKTVESYVSDVKGLMEYLSEMKVTFNGSLSILHHQIHPLSVHLLCHFTVNV